MRGQPAGQRCKFITIESPIESTHDTLAATEKSWKGYVIRWAALVPKTSREYYASNQVHIDMTHMLEMAYVPGLTSMMRVDFNGRKLNIIEAINVEERNITTRLLCSEIVGG
jgi:SPP1 family predicted phage head-tail adaptor